MKTSFQFVSKVPFTCSSLRTIIHYIRFNFTLCCWQNVVSYKHPCFDNSHHILLKKSLYKLQKSWLLITFPCRIELHYVTTHIMKYNFMIPIMVVCPPSHASIPCLTWRFHTFLFNEWTHTICQYPKSTWLTSIIFSLLFKQKTSQVGIFIKVHQT